MEYRWKEITKMGEISAKTYSMWNGQIPCGIGGQGKDLMGWLVTKSTLLTTFLALGTQIMNAPSMFGPHIMHWKF